ncbi:uncharacterized protein LOC105161783 [Sesamum indicum]|uniref:Uncharacterized protein LOC105161783 n=1 Tax=Sesamum indicum TaxID=4182 RepID=A0A8M8UZX7_SESIN|nr:uncharacterized protein LOC105161783 [Sesamum indicum]
MVQEIEVAPGLHFEADGPKPEVKENSDVENEETGSYDVCTSEIEVTVENTEELNGEKEIGPQDKAAVHNLDVTLEKFTELRLQQTTEEVSTRKMLEDVTEADFIDHLAISVQLNEEADKIEILQHDESTKVAADLVRSDGGVEVNYALSAVKDSPCKQLGDEPGAKGVPLGFAAELDSQLISQPTCLTPSKNSASNATATMKMVTAFTDNKENIGSGSKLVLVKDRVKTAENAIENADNLNELSVRKLSKMLKEKLEITKKSTKNDSGNEKALPRPALQALPENRLVDETQN